MPTGRRQGQRILSYSITSQSTGISDLEESPILRAKTVISVEIPTCSFSFITYQSPSAPPYEDTAVGPISVFARLLDYAH